MNVAKVVYKTLMNTQTITDVYTGECKGCGECCSRFLPLSLSDKIRIKQYLNTYDFALVPEVPGTVDMRCPFYTDDKMCAIYDVRPVICKKYRCDKHANGTLVFELRDMRGYETCDMRELVETYLKKGN